MLSLLSLVAGGITHMHSLNYLGNSIARTLISLTLECSGEDIRACAKHCKELERFPSFTLVHVPNVT
jgi:hypothetical protein